MSHLELIDNLGGTQSVADRFNKKLSTVSMWKINGVPWRYRHVVAKYARKKGVKLPPNFMEARE